MNVFYSNMNIDKEILSKDRIKIFLAGPTPRSKDVTSWRIEAIEILQSFSDSDSFDIYVPEREDWSVKFDYVDQVEWELQAIKGADYVIFWVPRNMENMPALTTNAEFGMCIKEKPDKIFYGRPDDAPNNRYLDFIYNKFTGRTPRKNLYDTLNAKIV